MTKWYTRVGNYIFDYIITGLLLIISTVLLLPFYAIYVGLIAFFKYDNQYNLIFKTIKENFKNILYMTIVMIVLLALIYLTLVIDNTTLKNNFNIVVRYLLIGLSINILIYPPIIMIEMKVTFKELVKNSLFLSLMQFSKTLFMFLITAVLIWLITVEVLIIFIFIPYVQTISYLSSKAIENYKIKREL